MIIVGAAKISDKDGGTPFYEGELELDIDIIVILGDEIWYLTMILAGTGSIPVVFCLLLCISGAVLFIWRRRANSSGYRAPTDEEAFIPYEDDAEDEEKAFY